MRNKFGNLSNYLKLTRKEYDASINALNLFFGAVIGVNLGGIEEIELQQYVALLTTTSTAVTTILFVSYSERRYWSIFLMLLALFGLWKLGNQEQLYELPPKLLPTLGLWAGIALLTQFSDIVEDDESEK